MIIFDMVTAHGVDPYGIIQRKRLCKSPNKNIMAEQCTLQNMVQGLYQCSLLVDGKRKATMKFTVIH